MGLVGRGKAAVRRGDDGRHLRAVRLLLRLLVVRSARGTADGRQRAARPQRAAAAAGAVEQKGGRRGSCVCVRVRVGAHFAAGSRHRLEGAAAVGGQVCRRGDGRQPLVEGGGDRVHPSEGGMADRHANRRRVVARGAAGEGVALGHRASAVRV